MEDLWPLFGLRLVSGSVVLRLPREHEIAELARVAATGVHHATERPFLTPWAEGSPEQRSRFVLREHWTSLASWTIDRWQLSLGVFVDDQPAGIVAIRAVDFPIVREVTSSSWLGLAHQGRGFGTDARRGVLALSFDSLHADAALTEVFQDNHASQGVSRKLGYVADGISRDRRGDEAVTSDRLRLTRAAWEAQDQPVVAVEGFDACREVFGI
jgi:RimJ/RimL family protein N-acetyltransferase